MGKIRTQKETPDKNNSPNSKTPRIQKKPQQSDCQIWYPHRTDLSRGTHKLDAEGARSAPDAASYIYTHNVPKLQIFFR